LYHPLLNPPPGGEMRVWDAAKTHTDEIHHTIPANPVGTLVVPETKPHWDYQTDDTTSRDQMVTCLVAGLKRAAQKVVNFDKLRKIQQEEKTNPASFLSRLTDVLRRHTKVDPEKQDGTIIFMTHFISQSAPNIRKKLK
jgi:hypothetical protein